MKRYRWNILGLCEVRYKNFGERTTPENHKFYFSGREDRHEHGVGFLVNKEVTGAVIACQPINSRIITIRLKSLPFNLTIIQAYAPTTDHPDEEVEDFYHQLQKVIDETPKKDILVVQGDWNGKIGKDAFNDWKSTCGPYCNDISNDRGLRLLEFASLNELKIMNNLGPHKKSRRMTWLSPGGLYQSQIDYIMIQQRFKSSVNIARTRTFPGADIGSDHSLVMMTFSLRLKKIQKAGGTRLKFNLEKLKDPTILESFKANIGGKFVPLLTLNEDVDVESLTHSFTSAITETASDIIGKHRPKKKPWITDEILELCDKRRELRWKKNTTEGLTQYRKTNLRVKNEINQAREAWIGDQCKDIEDSLLKNNSKKAFQTIKDLTSTKRSRTTIIQDSKGNCLTEEAQVRKRWTEYCSELYTHKIKGNPKVLTAPAATNNHKDSILREEIVSAVQSLKPGKSPGVDNITAELIKAGGDPIIDALLLICNKIWTTGEWPTSWTQSLIITLLKKGNVQLCQNYRTISLISHPSKVMLKVILRRLMP
nr:uncharacterized protein LOC125989972 [Syngnathus scovelli]